MVVKYIDEVQEKLKINGRSVFQKDIGVVTPYSKQCNEIRDRLFKRGSTEIFQGREKPIIIVSTVRTGDGLGFVGNAKRFDVLITRAQSLLIVLGDYKLLYKNEYWKAFIDHCFSLDAMMKDNRKMNDRISPPK